MKFPTARRTGSPAKRQVGRSGRGINTNSYPQAGRVININLNRPMIEHFTINTKEVKGGLNDLKHQVEEVLLEILNSANAIQ